MDASTDDPCNQNESFNAVLPKHPFNPEKKLVNVSYPTFDG